METHKLPLVSIYRPPSGDLDQALIELSEILDDLPKHSYIGGDFNIDLLQHKSKHIIDFEDVTMSRGFLPLISIVTHEKPGCKGSCIDNFITNDIENVLHTGTISDKISHHFPIVQIFQSNLKPIKNTTKCIQYYDYCYSNVDKFVEMLEEDLSSSSSIDDFGTFRQKFNTVLATTCNFDVPKCSKRTMQNNPWITGGLIVSINHCHDLYKA